MDILHSVFFHKFITNTEMSCIINLTCWNKVVIYKNCLIRVPYLSESHFLEFFFNKWNKNIMNHYSVNINSYDISRLYFPANILSNNLLNNCMSHYSYLSPS